MVQQQRKAFNLVRFAADAYTRRHRLEVLPRPASLVRISLVHQGVDHPMEGTVHIMAPADVEVPAAPVAPDFSGTESLAVVHEWSGCTLRTCGCALGARQKAESREVGWFVLAQDQQHVGLCAWDQVEFL